MPTLKNRFMSLFQILPFIMITLIIILITSATLFKRRNLPIELFIEAQKIENDGRFEEAVISYGSALDEVKKIRFQRGLKNKIIEKLKVLNTTIEYKNNLRFTR